MAKVTSIVREPAIWASRTDPVAASPSRLSLTKGEEMARRSAHSIEAVMQASTVMTRSLQDLSRELIILAEEHLRHTTRTVSVVLSGVLICGLLVVAASGSHPSTNYLAAIALVATITQWLG
jgi:hypothetical protein